MSILSEEVIEQLKEIFSELEAPVKLTFFGKLEECQFCKETKEILEAIEKITDKIILETNNLVDDNEKAKTFNIDKTPATIIGGENKDYGIRFFGIPAGYEFSSFIETIKMVSNKEAGNINEVPPKLNEINQMTNLKVFVTTSCPYCPAAVVAANKLAIENEHITSEMIEASEFSDFANKYNVMGVPRTIINEDEFIEGAVPEEMYVEQILETFK